MGLSVATEFDVAKRAFESVDAALSEPLSKLCFEGPLETLTLTANTQPAIVATSSALVAAIRAAHPSLPPPVVALGHSLGEYSALVAAGALSLEDAVRVCRARGQAMQDAVSPGEGAMSAVLNLTSEQVRALCEDASKDPEGGVVSPANFNAPSQTVIAGNKGAVERANKLAQERGGKAIPLNVSAPFHCALMRPAREKLAAALERVTIGALSIPVIANVDAEENTASDRVKDLLLQQIDAPVEWVRSIERMRTLGVTHAIEIGPGKVLAGLVKRISKEVKVINVSDGRAVSALPSLLESA